MASFRRVESAGSNSWYEARAGSAKVRVVITGTGRLAAQQAVNGAFDDMPDVCIASGFAGALKRDYVPGDVVTARQVTEIRTGRSLNSDGELLQLAEHAGAKVVDRLLVAERVIGTVAEKQQLGAKGDVVDMESACILDRAAQSAVRAVVIRSVSDAADRELPLDFESVLDDRGQVRMSQVLAQVASKPSRIAGLIRLGGDSARAANSLASVLNDFVKALSRSPELISKVGAVAL